VVFFSTATFDLFVNIVARAKNDADIAVYITAQRTWSSLRAVGPTGWKLGQFRDNRLCHKKLIEKG